MMNGKVNYDLESLITQLDGNSGDQSARAGEQYSGFEMNPDPDFKPLLSFKEAIRLLEPHKDGNIVRAAKAVGFFYQDLPVSRDQTLPLIIAAGYYGEKDFIRRVLLANIKRGFKYSNGDTLVTDFSVYIRAYKMAGGSSAWLLYPLLYAMDLNQVANSALIVFLKARTPGPIRRFLANKLGLYFFVQDYKGDPNNPDSWSKHGDTNVGSDINHTQISVQSMNSMPTLVGAFANWMYRAFRPHGIQYAFDVYHDPKSYGNPLNILWAPIIARYF